MFCTVCKVRLAQVQVLAGAGGAVLGAQGEAHGLDLLPQRVQGAEDLLHALATRQELGAGGVGGGRVGVELGQELAGVDGAFGLWTPLDGQRLDDLTWWALGGKFRCSELIKYLKFLCTLFYF